MTKVKKGFSALIGDMGQWYSLTLRFKAGKTVTFLDSLKLLPFRVKDIAKDFELEIDKGLIDYDVNDVNENTLDYVFRDVKIVAMALAKIKAEGMVKSTTASCAYSQYSSMVGDNFMLDAFPDLGTDFLTLWRKAYRGGRCQVNPVYQGRIMKNVYRYDINSMYPHVMNSCPLPYGRPITLKEKDMGTFKFELYHLRLEFSLKPNHMPTLLKKGSIYNNGDSYYIDTDGVEDIFINSVDYELLKRHYDITYFEYIEGVGFYTTTVLFKSYINKWYAKKNQDKGAKKIVDKFMLNCLYGKFGSNCRGAHKTPVMDTEKDLVKFDISEEEDMTHYYLPVAIAITAYAHKLIDDAITYVGYENFVYCDTDSVHCLVKLPDYMVDQKELGKFKLEAVETKSKYVRQKTYIVLEDNWHEMDTLSTKISITCAGMTSAMKESLIRDYSLGLDIFNVFKVGLSMAGKLLPKRVPGGTILHETTFEIK